MATYTPNLNLKKPSTGEKYDVIADLNDSKDKIDRQTVVTPEMFSGTDAQKIQQAYDYACAQPDYTTIVLNRTYDITGSTIYIPSTDWIKQSYFTKGCIKKMDAGFVFSRLASNMNINSPNFEGVAFMGATDAVTTVIDGDKMLRTNAVNCKFNSISLFKTIAYSQSLRVINCETEGQRSTFVKAPVHYDPNIVDNRVETASFPFFEGVEPQTGGYNVIGGRITNNLIEGFTACAPIRICAMIGTSISHNYFERNLYHLEFILDQNLSGEINGNNFSDAIGDFSIKFASNNTYRLEVSNNTSNIPFAPGKAFMSAIVENNKNNSLYAGGRLFPEGTIYIIPFDLNNNLSFTTDGGLTMVIPKLHPITTSQLVGNQFLINVGATFGSSTHYRASFVGILSIIGAYNVGLGALKYKAIITPVVMAGVGGNTTGADGVLADVNVVFNSTGSNEITADNPDTGVKINFPNLIHNVNYTHGGVKPLDSILIQAYATQA